MKPRSIRRRFAPARAGGLVVSLGVEVAPARAEEDIPRAVDAQRVRVLMTRTGTFGIGVKELQIFDTAA